MTRSSSSREPSSETMACSPGTTMTVETRSVLDVGSDKFCSLIGGSIPAKCTAQRCCGAGFIPRRSASARRPAHRPPGQHVRMHVEHALPYARAGIADGAELVDTERLSRAANPGQPTGRRDRVASQIRQIGKVLARHD